MIGEVDLKVLALCGGVVDHVLVAGHQVVRQGELMLQPGGGHLREGGGYGRNTGSQITTHIVLLLV